MSTDFHARPTAPVPATPAALRVARPMGLKADPRPRPMERVARPVDAPALPPPRPLPLAVPAPAPALPAPAPLAPVRPPFPRLRFSAIDVTAKAHEARGTRLWAAVGTLFAIGAGLAAIASTMGLALGGLLLAPVVDWFRARRTRAILEGSALRVSDQQLPELNSCLIEFSSRLGLKVIPEVYVVEHHTVNGFAAKVGRKDVVLLTDDVVWGALSAKNPRALGFVLAHELAHVALGHTRTFRSLLRLALKPLARLDELSADNVARALVDDDTVAFEGLKLLAIGPQLSPYVDDDALIAQANGVVANKLSKKVERQMSHPLIMRRVVNILE